MTVLRLGIICELVNFGEVFALFWWLVTRLNPISGRKWRCKSSFNVKAWHEEKGIYKANAPVWSALSITVPVAILALLVTEAPCRAMDIKEVCETKDTGSGCRLILSPLKDSPFTWSCCKDSSVLMSSVKPFHLKTLFSDRALTCHKPSLPSCLCKHRGFGNISRWDLFQISFQVPKDDEGLCLSTHLSNGNVEFISDTGAHREIALG